MLLSLFTSANMCFIHKNSKRMLLQQTCVLFTKIAALQHHEISNQSIR